jgi:hypothetical protein
MTEISGKINNKTTEWSGSKCTYINHANKKKKSEQISSPVQATEVQDKSKESVSIVMLLSPI